ncbi:hypothetical protein GALL_511710 [mine drainage metagenome]|uniref:Uncharacterized protein n=1 Tax=mine drainage metagenome TaxID=410659 RepID=A0A1J5PUN5_9ZZZZ
MPPRHGLGVAQIDLRARRSGGPKRQPAKLQARRRGLGALADQVEGKFAVFRLWIVVKDLKPIDDGAHRADEIVADPGTQQRRELEGIGGGTGRRGTRHKMFLKIDDKRGHDESRMLSGLIHCGHACCQHRANGARHAGPRTCGQETGIYEARP